MKSARKAKLSSESLLQQGREAFLAGRVYLAAEAFEKARKADPRNPVVLFNLASAKEWTGEIDAAAQLLSETIRLRPSWFEAAHRLSLLTGRYLIEEPGKLDPHGLLAAFAFDRIDRQPLAASALAHLQARSPLGAAIQKAKAGETGEAARHLILRRTDKVLSHPLLLTAIAASPNRNPELEWLLKAIRKVLLLECPAERFEDKALTGFTIALIRQCLINEYIFAATPEETQKLHDLPLDLAELLSGSPDQARHLMLHLLYRPPEKLTGKKLTIAECHAIRPRTLAELLASWLEEDDKQVILAADIPAMSAIADATSKKVAGQYEAHPYPRWNSLHMPREGSAKTALKRFFTQESLAFLDRPFKVLIAGSGTGQHAISAAIRYGPTADVLAIDLSRRSLAYAKAKADHFGVSNIRFAQADIQTLSSGHGAFDVIEAVGVLHHMAEPFKGWKALVELLRPGGFMLTGLYSALARKNIAELRSEADYPGPECGDDAALRYRESLMKRHDKAASDLIQSHDFYTLSEFRDLVLHEHERPVFLSEIEAFIQQSGLTFRGFQLPRPIVEMFLKSGLEDQWPGTLANWSDFEEKHPHTFDAMYRFWCEKSK